MNIGLQQLLVALFMLVPGFITTSIHRAFSPKRFSSNLHWTVASLIVALVLNGVLILPFLFGVQTVSWSSPLEGVIISLQEVSLRVALTYVLILYSLSTALGFVLGFFPQLNLRRLLNRFGLVSFAEHPSVWDRILAIRPPSDRPVTWLRIKLNDDRMILGHLRHCSEHIDKDQPFEIYLLNPHECKGDRWKPLDAIQPDMKVDGMYARLCHDQVAEFFFTKKDWTP